MCKTTIEDCLLLNIPKVHDERGSLAVIEKTAIPFKIERVYYLYDVPSDAFRGGHAHKNLNQLIIPLSGSFDIVLKDGVTSKKVTLNKPNKGLLLVPGIWREIDNFSSGSVCLVLASNVYIENDYIRNYTDFELFKSR
ncbi:MAG: sugar 3,4-ketoisomerase [Winogradskyella sp.]